MKTTAVITPEAILTPHSPEVRAIAQGLRQLIKETMPEAVEKAYPGWKGIGYRHPRAGYVCAIFPLEGMVKLGFEYGAFLPDSAGVLKQGSSKGARVRYLELPAGEDLPKGVIESLLQAAVLWRS